MIVQIEVPDGDPELTRYIVRHILQGAALGCRPFFVGPHALPPLYDTPVRYDLEPSYGSGKQVFRLPPDVLSRGRADCGSLCIYEVARRQARRKSDSVSIADWLGDNSMHAQIRRPDGSIEDPSIQLGAVADWPASFLYDR
jgi:hypothetical protein